MTRGVFALSRHDADAGEPDHVQVGDMKFVGAGGDATEALQALEEAFDQRSGSVGCLVERTLTGRMAVGMRRRNELPAERRRTVATRPTLVGAVGDESRATALRTELFEQMPAPGRIAGLARRLSHHQRQPVVTRDRVQLGRQAPTRAADGLAPNVRSASAPSWCSWTTQTQPPLALPGVSFQPNARRSRRILRTALSRRDVSRRSTFTRAGIRGQQRVFGSTLRLAHVAQSGGTCRRGERS